MSDTSSVAELRAAHERLRALAADATPGPWYAVMDDGDDASGFNYGLGSVPGLRNIAGNSWDGGFERLANARYAAIVHPSVGAALAAWLASSADQEDALGFGIDPYARVVARLILGEGQR